MLTRCLHLLALTALATAFPVAAHHVDDGSAQGAAASQSSAVEETLSGVVDELVVNDQVKGAAQRYPILRQADGSRVALRGGAIQVLAAGAQVEVTGNRTGMTFTVAHVGAQNLGSKTVPAAPGSPAQVEGRFMVAHSDNFETGTSRFIYQVIDANGNATEIDMPFLPSPMASGMQVVVNGNFATDGSIVAQHISIQTAPPVLAASSTINYLVLPIKFPVSGSGTAMDPWVYGADPFTPASLNNLVFGSLPTYKSAQEYFKEVSYGQQLMAGATADNGSGGFLLATVAKPATCDINVIANAAGAAAHARGYPIDASGNPTGPYTGILYVFNGVAGCGWSGLAYVGWPRAYSNNTSALWVIGHELGHNFGLLHAGSLACSAPAAPIGCGATGSVAEYGDPFSAMGNSGNVGHFNAAQKDILGWIAPSTVKAHPGGTVTYTLSPIETGGQPAYAVRVPTNNAKRTYWLEYRQPAGTFDAFITGGYPNNGVQVRIEYPFEKSSGSDDTEILDMTPATPNNFHDAALLAGAPMFIDPLTKVSLHVLSATSGANGLLTVQVTSPTAMARTDFNADQKSDIVFDNGSGSRWLYTMNGAAVQTTSAFPAPVPGWALAGVGDFNGDGKADLLWSNTADPTQFRVDLMNGTSTIGSGLLHVAAGYLPTQIGDFDGDGKDDILWEKPASSSWIYFMNGSAFASAHTAPAAAAGWEIVGVGDFNGDGKADLLWRNTADPTQFWIYLMNGFATTGGGMVSVAAGYLPTQIGDFDGNGKSDILWEKSGSGSWIYFMNGAGIAAAQPAPGAAAGWVVAQVGDFDGDGKADLLWQNSASPSQFWVYLMNGASVIGSGALNASAGYQPLAH